jgi:anti-sigma regulatory factor (Ser/Thr protein kinase)
VVVDRPRLRAAEIIVVIEVWVQDSTGLRSLRRTLQPLAQRAGRAAADVVLAVGELAANALAHAGPPCHVTGEYDERRAVICVAVADTSAAPLTWSATMPPADEVGGRGLPIVATVASRWGVRLTTFGKSVWCEFDIVDA